MSRRPSIRSAIRYSAIVAILSRFGGVAFFLVVGGGYIVFGLFDLVFGLPLAMLLYLSWQRRDDRR